MFEHKADKWALILCLGMPLIASIGVKWFNNRYISVAYILLTGFVYLFMKREEHGQQSTNITD